ncbi:hypothetical protein M8C13_38740 [Crossiella sp. SN42]|uniref:hypothetical protein n=1 Tax=Crossiella sp. SN42 TaxID=2944808 RepID=UPI00207C27DC|nr:hypothetical protein [Crossiella sp. SN42]MCO1581704.1 hypothetical protein [Crossiella sp. SN42]
MNEQNNTGDGQNRLAEEARLLLDALAERAVPWLRKLAAEQPGDEHSPASCGWCPLCAAIAVARGERPELAVRAAEHLAGLLGTLRAAMEERVPAAPGQDVGATPPPAGSPGTEAPSAPRVQRITVEREC